MYLSIFMYMYVYVCIWICTCICIYVYDSICWAWKRPVHCAEQLLELKICISPQFRAIDPPNPARGFIQQNENVRLATAACMQKHGNVSFATVACAKCMRYGGGWGTIPLGGGVGIRDPDSYIYIYTYISMYVYIHFKHTYTDTPFKQVLREESDQSILCNDGKRSMILGSETIDFCILKLSDRVIWCVLLHW